MRSRRAELAGYQMAIESRISKIESAVWLNTIISKLWRIDSGGLEPLLSTSAGSILSETLTHPYSKPSVVAHVSLNSLTLGSAPPIISRVEMKGTDDEKSLVFLEVDLTLCLVYCWDNCGGISKLVLGLDPSFLYNACIDILVLYLLSRRITISSGMKPSVIVFKLGLEVKVYTFESTTQITPFGQSVRWNSLAAGLRLGDGDDEARDIKIIHLNFSILSWIHQHGHSNCLVGIFDGFQMLLHFNKYKIL